MVSDTGPVNGQARTDVARIDQRVTDALDREAECRRQNSKEHDELFERMRVLEVGLATLQTRVALWAAVATAVASVLVQVAFKVWG